MENAINKRIGEFFLAPTLKLQRKRWVNLRENHLDLMISFFGGFLQGVCFPLIFTDDLADVC